MQNQKSLDSILDGIEERCRKATEGPWVPVQDKSGYGLPPGERGKYSFGYVRKGDGTSIHTETCTTGSWERNKHDTVFIAEARQDLPLLLKLVRAYRKEFGHTDKAREIEKEATT